MSRCEGQKQNGERCTRDAEAGERYCWQHPNESGDSPDSSDSHARLKYDPEAMVEALREAEGSVRSAAKMLGCHRSTIYEYMEKFDRIAEALGATRNQLKNHARTTLADLLDARDDQVRAKAAKTVVRHYDDDTEPDQVEHTGEGGEPLEVVINDSVVERRDDS